MQSSLIVDRSNHEHFAVLERRDRKPVESVAPTAVQLAPDSYLIEEIDRYWQQLSAVPEAAQCGWLKDVYGVSWQIVPRGMDELLGGNDRARIDWVTQVFLQMKKIDLAKLGEVYQREPRLSSDGRSRTDSVMSEPRTQTLDVPGGMLVCDGRLFP